MRRSEPSDTVDRLNFPKMEKVIRLAYGTALEIANAPVAPRFGPAAVKRALGRPAPQ